MATHLFKQFVEAPEPGDPVDPYATGGLRVWDDYQFRRKGARGGGGPPRVQAPINVVLPLISGQLFVPEALFCSNGTWTGTERIHYAYQWYRIALPPEATPPVISGLPSISGVEIEDEILTCFRGSWSGTTPIFYEYQWYRVEGAGPPSPPVAGSPIPSVSGSTTRGSILHVTTGAWTGSPTPTFSYQWKRLPSTLIGVNSSSYMTLVGDVGSDITCTVTATNASGVVPQAASNSIGPIVEPVPGEFLTDEDGEVLTDEDGEELTT